MGVTLVTVSNLLSHCLCHSGLTPLILTVSLGHVTPDENSARLQCACAVSIPATELQWVSVQNIVVVQLMSLFIVPILGRFEKKWANSGIFFYKKYTFNTFGLLWFETMMAIISYYCREH